MRNNKFHGWSRREVLGGLAATGAAAMIGLQPGYAVAVAEPPPETTRIRIRQWRPACWAPIHVAEPLLRNEGFTDVQYVTGPGPKYAQMLKDGVVDLSPTFSALDMYNVEKLKPPLKLISGLHVGCYALVGSERVNSVLDLKRRTVWTGSVENNGPHLFFSAIVAYVGLDPRRDIKYAWVKKDEAMRLFNEGKIDAFMSFPPGPQELMAKGIGRLLVDTNVDKPWSQYFCCTISGHSEFIKKNPVATKRALRAILKANDIVARDPEHALSVLMKKKIWKKAETKYILQSLSDIPYGKWREYDPEDTIRFFALRMREVGLIKTAPEEFIEQHCDWSLLNELKKEFGITW